nr:MAG TPA: DNA binding protein [Microviridae sp.]
MIYGVYAIKDAKTTFMPANVDYNDASAIRNFEHAVRQPDSLLQSHPADYSLWKLGTFDNESGSIVPLWPIEQLADASSILKEV